MKQKRIFALGFFDGVHLGHQALLAECVRIARSIGAQPASITFDQHPKALYTQNYPMLINTLEDRKRLLHHYQIEHIHVVPVNEETMNKPWRAFLEELVEDGAAGFVCGDDFHFGHKGIGHAGKLEAYCQEHGFPCKIIQEQTLGRIRISSTRVRSLITAGEMETAALFLGHPHIFSGEVVHGRHFGRTMGVPTANVLIPEGMVIPRLGVYVTSCQLGDKTYAAVCRTLQDIPDLSYIYMANPSVAACIDAIRDCGRVGTVRVLSHDAGAEIRRYLREGLVDFTIDQNLFLQTYQALDILYRLVAEYKKPEKKLYYSKNSILNAEMI